MLQVMTPFLTAKLAGQFVAVDAVGLLMSTLQIVLLPVLGGAFLNQYFQGLVKLFSCDAHHCCCNCSCSMWECNCQNASAILMSGRQVVLAAALLHASGFFFGYILSRILGLDVSSSRTISIEVGMQMKWQRFSSLPSIMVWCVVNVLIHWSMFQNSVLGVVLATQHFGNPLTAVPCAVSSVCHSVFGSVLAGIWRRSPPVKVQD
ncbi:putative sodium/metabolite cotransporter BASS1, chloroplastic [Vitis vinifera]|uniref:Putative sodium/metabolite cotransporter BASS1, chloroplastic n=1 Tax=Vitis vinifera TaxID=29760 RepID=A0A438HC11_VITVI|nr:putative sodium/metabolite cotransporter BASS1, chloroplastic [Vitis vinifera]